MSELPDSWKRCQLGDVVNYGSTQKAEPDEIELDSWVLELEDIEKDTSRVLQRLTFAQRKSKSTKNRFFAGDVLYGKLRPYLNKVIIADQSGFCSTEIIPLTPSRWLDGRYLFYWLKHPEFLDYVTSVSHGLNMPRLGTKAGRDAPFVLAPLNEQKRIADKLDTMLARVDACRERLDRIPTILKRFRQSVLAAATSGKLTEEWRQKHGISISSWRQSTVDQLIDGIEAGLNVKCAERPPNQDERGLVKISAVTWGVYDDNESKTLPPDKEVPESARIGVGDFLISRANTLELVGACVIVRQVTRPVFLSDKVLRLVMPEKIKPWLLIVLRSNIGRKQIEQLASGNQLSMRNLSQANLRKITVPLPDEEEQAEIVQRVESLFAWANRLEARYAAAQNKVERLTPVLLAKAFRGELVPQDPNDEPASVLLERIRAARAAEKPKARRRKITRNKKMEKLTIETVRELIGQMPEDQFSFDELLSQVSADYESFKDILFSLIADPKSGLKQVFDHKTEAMRLVRVKS